MFRFVIALLAISIAGTALAADPPKKAPTTEAFLAEVAVGNQFEIQSSQLALAKTKNEGVRSFANRMVADHSEAGAKFTKAVSDAKLKAPSTAMDAKHQAILDDLAKKDGAALDSAYVEAQHKAHAETVELFQAYANGGDNTRIKQFAQELLPTLKSHLDQVGKLH
jgi:putative membrane protein